MPRNSQYFGQFSRFYLILMAGAALLGSGCQDRLLVEDRTPFGEGVVRLGDTAVAEIDGTQIYLSDVERAAAAQGVIEAGSSLTPDNPLFRRVLDELIDQRLLALDALRRALDQQDETRRRLAVGRERILGNALVEAHLAARINDETLRRMYDEQSALRQSGPERRVSHILVADEAAILAVIKRLEAGEDFATIAREVSLDRASREEGGSLGYIKRDMYGPVFTQNAFDTPIGVLSGPFQSEFGWHVLRPEASRVAKTPTYEDMRDEILNFMTYDEIQTLLKNLRTGGDIKLLFGPAVIGGGDDSQDNKTGDVTPNE